MGHGQFAKRGNLVDYGAELRFHKDACRGVASKIRLRKEMFASSCSFMILALRSPNYFIRIFFTERTDRLDICSPSFSSRGLIVFIFAPPLFFKEGVGGSSFIFSLIRSQTPSIFVSGKRGDVSIEHSSLNHHSPLASGFLLEKFQQPQHNPSTAVNPNFV